MTAEAYSTVLEVVGELARRGALAPDVRAELERGARADAQRWSTLARNASGPQARAELTLLADAAADLAGELADLETPAERQRRFSRENAETAARLRRSEYGAVRAIAGAYDIAASEHARCAAEIDARGG